MLFLLVITNFFGGEISLTTILIILFMIYFILNGIIIRKKEGLFFSFSVAISSIAWLLVQKPDLSSVDMVYNIGLGIAYFVLGLFIYFDVIPEKWTGT